MLSGTSSITTPGNSVSYKEDQKIQTDYHCNVRVLIEEIANNGKLNLKVIKPDILYAWNIVRFILLKDGLLRGNKYLGFSARTQRHKLIVFVKATSSSSSELLNSIARRLIQTLDILKLHLCCSCCPSRLWLLQHCLIPSSYSAIGIVISRIDH